jgi:hypothetical protein
MKKTVEAKHDYETIVKKYNTLHLYIGTFFLFIGSLSVGILMVMFFLNTLGFFFSKLSG